jgi:hypothetical protein
MGRRVLRATEGLMVSAALLVVVAADSAAAASRASASAVIGEAQETRDCGTVTRASEGARMARLTAYRKLRCEEARVTVTRMIRANMTRSPSFAFENWTCAATDDLFRCDKGQGTTKRMTFRNASGAGGIVRECADVVFAPNSEDAAFDVRTRGTSCDPAREIIVAVRRDDALRPRGFACSYRTITGEAIPSARYTCTKGTATVRWVYGGPGRPLSAPCSGPSVSSTRITDVRAYQGVTCGRAREVIRLVYAGRPVPRGWSCSTAGTEGGCARPTADKRQLLTWRAPDVDS